MYELGYDEYPISVPAPAGGNQSRESFGVNPFVDLGVGKASFIDSPPSFIAKSQADGFAKFGNVATGFTSGEFVTGGKTANAGFALPIIIGVVVLGLVLVLKGK